MPEVLVPPSSAAQYLTVAAGASTVTRVSTYDRGVAILAHPQTGATAKVEYTLSSPQDVLDGNAAWSNWAPGDAVAPAFKDGVLAFPFTALRLSSTGGPTKFSVLA